MHTAAQNKMPRGSEVSASRVETLASARADRDFRARFRVISPGFFNTFGVPIQEGRDFNDADKDGSERVVIISQSLAKLLYPGQDAVNWQGHLLPYRSLIKDQTVRTAAIGENKRLRHALAVVKVKQDQKQAVKIMNNSEKIGYKKRPHAVCGPDCAPDIMSFAL